MPVLQILILIFFMAVVPLALGAGGTAFVEKMERNICFIWISGYLLLFMLFQITAVPMVLKRCTLTELTGVFGVVCVIAALAGGALWVCRIGKKTSLHVVKDKRCDKISVILWGLFGGLLLVQLFAAVFLAFGDGDDSYYVAVSTVAVESDKMYTILTYTGGPTSLDYRHVLAPLPMFAAFLSKVTGLHAATVSHIAMQLFLIPTTYAVYGLLGSRFLKGRKRELAVFMIFASVIIMWGNYSIYTAETFLLTRTRQGKAAIANLVIPALILLMYLIGERLAEKKKVEKALWVLVFAAVTSACLCSSFGGFLTALLLGVTGLCIIVSFKRWKLLFPFCISVLPGAVYSVMYVILR